MSSLRVILSIFLVWPAAFTLADLKCTHEFRFDDPSSYKNVSSLVVMAVKGNDVMFFGEFGSNSLVADFGGKPYRLIAGKSRAYVLAQDETSGNVYNVYVFDIEQIKSVGSRWIFTSDQAAPAGRSSLDAFVLYRNEFVRADKCEIFSEQNGGKFNDKGQKITTPCQDFCKALKAGKGSCLFDPYDVNATEHTVGYATTNCITFAKLGDVTYLSDERGKVGRDVVCLRASNPNATYNYPQFVSFDEGAVPCDYNAFISKLLPRTVELYTTTTTTTTTTTETPTTVDPASDATFLGGSWFWMLMAAIFSSLMAL